MLKLLSKFWLLPALFRWQRYKATTAECQSRRACHRVAPIADYKDGNLASSISILIPTQGLCGGPLLVVRCSSCHQEVDRSATLLLRGWPCRADTSMGLWQTAMAMANKPSRETSWQDKHYGLITTISAGHVPSVLRNCQTNHNYHTEHVGAVNPTLIMSWHMGLLRILSLLLSQERRTRLAGVLQAGRRPWPAGSEGGVPAHDISIIEDLETPWRAKGAWRQP